jgi:hypothetical protein
MSGRRGGIPGPESRTGLVRPPAMTEAEFERQQGTPSAAESAGAPEPEPAGRGSAAAAVATTSTTSRSTRTAATRSRGSKPRRVQRMFALEEDLDKKLWLYAIHVGKDRSEVINDLLRPLVASMVLYDSRDRRAARAADPGPDADGSAADEGN